MPDEAGGQSAISMRRSLAATLAEPRAFVAYCGSQGELEFMLEVASEAAVGLARERVAQGERWPRG